MCIHNTNYVYGHNKKKERKEMHISLFKHNKDAYDVALEMLAETGKSAIVHPTGTGKSFIAFKLCEDHGDKTVCWLSPSEYIFRTQLENVSTANKGYCPNNIKFFTYAKLMSMSREEMETIEPDYIILDEFHRCGAEMWGLGVQTLLKLYEGVPILGLSATAIRYLDNRRDMSDELFDGNVASEMTLGEAIVRGILAPPTYVTALYSYKKDFERYERRVKQAQSKIIRDAGEKYLEALRRALEMADGLDVIFEKYITNRSGKYIVFCSNAEHMREMIGNVPLWFGKIDPEVHIYSAYSNDPETSKAFNKFKEDNSDNLKLLFCIDMLNEGVHVNDVSGVILFRPTVSPIIFKQQIGRALSAGKSSNAVILDIVNNIENLYSISDVEEEMREAISYYNFIGQEQYIVNESFKVIDEVHDCRVLFDELERTLAASFEYMLEEARKYYESHGDLLPLMSYETSEGYKLGQWVVTQRVAYSKNELSAERIAQLEAVGMNWLNLHQRQWEEGFRLAEDFYQKYGDLSTVDSRSRLGTWLIRQRQNYKKKLLTKEQFSRLDSLGMVWELDDVWQKRYEEASEYYVDHGDLDIPAGYVTENGVRLGIWYRSVKAQYRSGLLSEERIKLLEAIGMKWTSVKVRTWMRFFDLAKEYYLENGDLNVSVTYKTEDGIALGVWISTQRYSYSQGKLSPEYISMLKSIGMSWHRDKSRWETGFCYAVEFKNEFGHLNVAADYVAGDGFALGAWISNQRRKYKSAKLTELQITRLEELGLIWDPTEAMWAFSYERARAYYLEHGNLTVSSQYVTDDGFKLGAWISNQRTKYKNSKLEDSRISMLEDIGMCWSLNTEKWMIGFEHAKAYFKEFGNLHISQSYVSPDGYELGIWIYSQKKALKNERLDADKLRLLLIIGIDWLSIDESDVPTRRASVFAT